MTPNDSATASRWLRRFHPAPHAPSRLLCFPHAGGSASFFFPVSRGLSPRVDVVSVQYPGRQDRRAEACLESVQNLADALAPRVLSLADRPLTFFGHSLGATLAFEVARRLEAEGVVLTALFASGRRAPSRHRDEHVHELDDDALLREIRLLDGTENNVLADEEIVRMILPALRADYRAAETYRYREGPLLHCPVTALIGASDPRVSVEEALAWREHTTGPFTHRVFEGGHFYINAHAASVTEDLAGHAASLV